MHVEIDVGGWWCKLIHSGLSIAGICFVGATRRRDSKPHENKMSCIGRAGSLSVVMSGGGLCIFFYTSRAEVVLRLAAWGRGARMADVFGSFLG